ncbi:hypothetical protein LguiA_031475 [Lonicera macranthoides]
MDKYEGLKPAFGTDGVTDMIYKATNQETKHAVVIKDIPFDEKEGLPVEIKREISSLQSVHHENIVSLLEVVYQTTEVRLIFEALDGDLKTHLETHRYFMRDHIKSFLIQILRGVHHCHFNQILHRDLCPSNILVDWKRKIIKVADFGMSREHISETPKSYTQGVQSLKYRAPEVLLGLHRYGSAIDIWSVGCIFAEMLNGQRLFDGAGVIQQLQSIISIMGTPTEDTWPGVTQSTVLPHLPAIQSQDLASFVNPSLTPEGVDLLSKMLCMDPSRRITAEAALNHPYLSVDVPAFDPSALVYQVD